MTDLHTMNSRVLERAESETWQNYYFTRSGGFRSELIYPTADAARAYSDEFFRIAAAWLEGGEDPDEPIEGPYGTTIPLSEILFAVPTRG